jgi:hypothetical protein
MAIFPIVNRGLVTKKMVSNVKITTSKGVNIEIKSGEGVNIGSTPVSYILENRADSIGVVKALEFSWEQYKSSLTLPLRIEVSNNLIDWRSLTPRATVMRVLFQSEKLEKRVVNIPATTARYFRITPDQRAGLVKIKGVKATYYKREVSVQKRSWVDIKIIVKDTSLSNSFIFSTGGFIPFDSIRFAAPTTGVLYRGSLSYRDSTGATWRPLRDFVQYNLISNGDTISSSPIAVSLQNHREWMVKFYAPQDVDSSILPKISLSIVPKAVEFLARGDAPFIFAYGNDTLTTSSQRYTPMGKPISVNLSSPKDIGGGISDRDAIKEPSLPIRVIILWVILIFGVGLVWWMARTLIKELKSDS